MHRSIISIRLECLALLAFGGHSVGCVMGHDASMLMLMLECWPMTLASKRMCQQQHRKQQVICSNAMQLTVTFATIQPGSAQGKLRHARCTEEQTCSGFPSLLWQLQSLYHWTKLAAHRCQSALSPEAPQQMTCTRTNYRRRSTCTSEGGELVNPGSGLPVCNLCTHQQHSTKPNQRFENVYVML